MRTGNIKSRSYAHGLEALQTVPTGESMTRQDQADMVNINKIYAKTQRGEIVLAKDTMPTFGDFTNPLTYDLMLEKIMEAEDAFMQLPSEERAKYAHDPRNYYEEVHKEALSAKTKEEEGLAREEEEKRQQQAIADAEKLLSKQPPKPDK